MIQGVMLLWFILTALSFLFVAIDIPKTPEDKVIKWAFVILVIFTGPIGAFFYVLGCREPIKGTHEQFVAPRWKQVLGSTMHCAAGDGIGIIAGAVIASYLKITGLWDFGLEYILGFSFGWAFFQAYAMKGMAGGSYLKSLKISFLPEFLSMNLLMTGMVMTISALRSRIVGGDDPLQPGFWFVMSMAILVGFIFAYPMNWWLVSNGMKHGMITVRNDNDPHSGMEMGHGHQEHGHGEMPPKPSSSRIAKMTVLSILCLVVGVVISQVLI